MNNKQLESQNNDVNAIMQQIVRQKKANEQDIQSYFNQYYSHNSLLV